MEPTAGVFARRAPYLERYVQIGAVGTRVIGVTFPTEKPSDASPEHPVLDSIEAYLDGTTEDLTAIEVALTVDGDTRAVLDAVREIPYGHERDLATLTRLTPGIDPDGVDMVRAALADNPVPLIVPDHRITDGPSAAPRDVVAKLRALEGLA